jgi:hypothetical protein
MNDHILKQLEIILKLSFTDNVKNVEFRFNLINDLTLTLIEDIGNWQKQEVK